MAQWYVVRKAKEYGPFEDAQLKALAAQGKLSTDDLIRRSDKESTVLASQVRGLFDSPDRTAPRNESSDTMSQAKAASAPKTAPPPTVGADRSSKDAVAHPSASVASDHRPPPLPAPQSGGGASETSGKADGTVPPPMPHDAEGASVHQGSQWVSAWQFIGAALRNEKNDHPVVRLFSWGAAVVLLLVVYSGRSSKPKRVVPATQPSVTSEDSAAGPVPTEAAVPQAPDFSDLQYDYDFASVDYESIPAGSRREAHDFESYGSRGGATYSRADGYVPENGDFTYHGKETIWKDASKQKISEENWWFHGKRHGKSTGFNDAGEAVSIDTFVNDKRQGLKEGRSPDGIKYQKLFYDGKPHGPTTEWYSDGPKAFAGSYVSGELHGPATHWFKDGTEHITEYWDNGVRVGPYVRYLKADGGNREILMEGNFRKGKAVGMWKRRVTFPNGTHELVDVDAGPWLGGSRKDFLARMILKVALEGRKTVIKEGVTGLHNNNTSGPLPAVAGLASNDAEQVVELCGPPDIDVPHPRESGSSPSIQRANRLYGYRCTDGPLMFLVRLPPNGAVEMVIDAKNTPP